MRRDKADAAWLSDMLRASRRVVEFTAGMSLEQYATNWLVQSAVERQIEIVGEAANRVSTEFQSRHPEIPWRGIIAQRHVLAHEYGTIEHDRIWKIIAVHIPDLIRSLEPLIPPVPT